MEFEIGRTIAEEGSQKLFGQALTIYRKLGFKDINSGIKFGIIEMDLADSSLKAIIE